MGKGKKKGGGKPAEAPKPDQAESEPSVSTSREETPKAEPAAPAPKVEVETVVEEMDGLGIAGSKKKRPRKNKKQSESASSSSVPQPEPTPGGQQPSGASGQPKAGPHSAPQQRGPPVGHQAPPGFPQLGPQGPPQLGSSQGGPTGFAQPQVLPQPPQQWRQPGPPGFASPAAGDTGSAGRGRGRGQGHPQLQQRPVAPPQGSQPQVMQPPQTMAIQSQSPSKPLTTCLYRVPEKIIGCNVPARSVRLLVNYLPMTFKPISLYRYDVSFNPEKPKKFISAAYNKAKQNLFPKHLMAFDQMKNCYCKNPLPNVRPTERLATVVELQDPNGRIMNFEVSFKFTGTVNLDTIEKYMSLGGTSLNPPSEAIQSIDVILRQGTLESYVKAGRQFFKRPGNPVDLGDGLEMWTGLFQSAIFTSRAFVNIDVAHKGFPKQQPLVEALMRDFRLDPSQPVDRQRGRGVENFNSFIRGVKVIACIGGDTSARGQRREFICNELVKSPREMTFKMKDASGKEVPVTVEQYFLKEKGIRLQYPNLNCVWVGPRDKNIYYPMELLTVAYGQAMNRQLNEMQLATMVRQAATPPDVRKKKIEEVISSIKYSTNAYFKEFGLDIKNEFHAVEAKVLKPPTIDTGAGGLVQPRKGAWFANKLLKPEALDKWVFIAIELDPQQSNSDFIIKSLQQEGSRLGMRIGTPLVQHNLRISELRNRLMNCVDNKITFAVIVVPTRGRDYYHRVKQVAELEVGILTQCIKEFTAARKMSNQTAKNILLKVNSKLMGVNQVLDRSSTPRSFANNDVMVLGADVTHPSADQMSVPSIAAVSASMDVKCFVYNIQLSIQTPKKEVIVEFEDMVLEHLKMYKQIHNKLPKKMFVFRDGVSEGQFAEVMNSELSAVHKAYKRLAPNDKPEVLFLLVQKRHHTRFFLPNSPLNVEPGTVVDKDIVHARELDFYLVSHDAIKGTARPTRYHAVCNDGKIPSDEVEQITYYLCHLYSRCPRSVSYPTPTYYAHLACMRARSLTYGERFNNQDLERQPRRLNVLDRMLRQSRMFFV